MVKWLAYIYVITDTNTAILYTYQKWYCRVDLASALSRAHASEKGGRDSVKMDID
ncbi:hypothetical protein ETAR_16000 [Edwardsiella tarda]|nr:hypothetical protein GBS0709_15460 [Edwardsiella tarda]